MVVGAYWSISDGHILI